jgi:hypothetical protein
MHDTFKMYFTDPAYIYFELLQCSGNVDFFTSLTNSFNLESDKVSVDTNFENLIYALNISEKSELNI